MSGTPYDITIVGAGPAGATLARLLEPRHRVLLVDRRELASVEPEPRLRKACGGLVAPDAQAMLARLGLGIPQEVLVGPQLFVVRTLDLQARRERHYQRFYINVDRERFDRWLVSLVPASVERRFATHVSACRRLDGHFQLSLRSSEGTCEITSRLVIGADGAHSKIRACCLAAWPGAPREYLAVQDWMETDSAPPHFGVIFDSELTDFYAWTIPKGNAVLLGAAVPAGPEARARFDAFRQRLARGPFQLGRTLRREGHMLLRLSLFGGPPPVQEGLLIIGEAGGFISPSSAEGFSYAFRSALAAAEVLNEGLEAAAFRFARRTRGLRGSLKLKNLKAPFMYQPWLRRAVMATGIKHLPLVQPR